MKKIVAIIVALAVLCMAWFMLMLRPVGSAASASSVVAITKGASVSSIATTLSAQGLIRSPFAFKVLSRLTGAHSKLKAGTYTLSPSQSAGDILSILAGGETTDISITIPEGFTIAQIDALLASKGLGKPGDILDCAFTCTFEEYSFLPSRNAATRTQGYGSKVEGYLFPDTYFVSVTDYQPKAFIGRLLKTFQMRIADKYKSEIDKSGHKLVDIVTMASLLEEESRPNGDEREMVAGILWKRWRAGTLLGVDATVRYVLGKPKAPITDSDLKTVSAYNTRKVAGLPPGPIANPSESAFRAALLPIDSPYWYYLHDKKGEIHYAKTNDEHNQNRATYLR